MVNDACSMYFDGAERVESRRKYQTPSFQYSIILI
jgi:hypothetical protein